MVDQVIKRLLFLVPILLGVVFVTFIIIHAIPGNPAVVILGLDATPENIAKLEKKMGLDKPLATQYMIYVKQLLRGDLGYSYRTERPIFREIRTRYPNTISLAIVAVLVFLAIFGPWIAPYNPDEQNLHNVLKSVSLNHLLGTDEFGRDILSRIIYGTKITLMIVVSSVLLGGILGCILGVFSGYLGRYVDTIIMRLMDMPLAFPGMLLSLAIVEIVGKGILGVIIATSIYSIPQFARVVRASILSTRESLFVKGARVLGESNFSIILRYILPNIWAPILVLATTRAAIVILIASSLSFLGLGVQPPTTEWGAMIAAGKMYLVRAPHLTLFPGLAIVITILGFNLIGDALRDIMDVKLQ